MTSAGLGLGVAVRLQWPDGRHDLFGHTHDVEAAIRALEGQRRYWRRGPVRPTALYLVAVSEQAVKDHPTSGCRSASCPGYPIGEIR
ncbi:hypothetical protein [Micromonospora sp. WMMD980]|uniref:hypothetical protein n=1 Tax=Micromonospora sp. WMMD980 TaxID=3016088 RepID=UPI0024172A8C|nr:hypothetical protein [Micromonospora sp. WMMD980]MDG4803694.1 hypothetical protein [Micromonospora sp. WMMD980]